MGRKKKQEVTINNTDSLEGLMQETYNDACLQISDTQRAINELSTAATPEDVEDLTKVVREKSNLLKVKDSAIKIKLELAKLQSDILKANGNVAEAIETRSDGQVSVDDFSEIRRMIKKNKSNDDENEDSPLN